MGTILIVDDDSNNIDLIAFILRRMGYETDQALDGKDALEKLKTNTYLCVLLDVMMPGMDGIEVCTIMKNSPELKDIPVIITTALPPEHIQERAENAGADGFMHKPVLFEELTEYLQRHLDLVLHNK